MEAAQTIASEKLVDWWNKRLPFIEEQVEADNAAGLNGRFEWGQLVWQELEMWEKLKLDKKEMLGELDWIVKRRGFNDVKRAFLIEGLKHLGLWTSE